MAQKGDLMAGGMNAPLAGRLGFDASTAALTATGTTVADALATASNYLLVGTAAANTGVLLMGGHGFWFVVNNGASPVKVYPPTGTAFNGGSANAAFSVTNGKAAFFIANGTNIGAILSA